MDNQTWKERRQRLQSLIDYILNNVEDAQSIEVQKRLNQIEELYFECFDKYEF